MSPTCVSLLGLISLLSLGPARAQTADAIVQSLRPKTVTRSFVRHPTLSSEDQQFLHGLPTRSIRLDQREKLSEIVKKDALPKIDLTINFDYDSDVVAPTSIPTLIELGKALTNSSLNAAHILLNGHTDAAGTERYNLVLSERRAQAVKSYLVTHFGIHDDRLFAVGYGREQLKNKADPLSAENRRVEIVNLGPTDGRLHLVRPSTEAWTARAASPERGRVQLVLGRTAIVLLCLTAALLPIPAASWTGLRTWTSLAAS